MAEDLKIILHLGPHKTGSTSIQRNFFAHKEVLAKQYIHFLGRYCLYLNLFSAFMTDPTKNYRNGLASKSLKEIQERDRKVRDDLYEQLSNLTGTAVLSSEFLCLMQPEEFARINAALSKFGEVHALYYYRELMPWISSNSQQMAKVGRFFRPSVYWPSVKRLHRFPLRVAKEFGDKAHFIKFEDAVKIGICNSLLQEFGLPDFSAMALTETRENESLSADAVRAMYLYNLQNPIGSGRRDPKKIAELCALPGEKYKIDGLRPKEIRDYARKRAEVSEKLGFRLISETEIPVAMNMDRKNAREIAPFLPLRERLKAVARSLARI